VNLFSRITPSSGAIVTISNTEYHIPGGTLIGYSAWSMHRNNRALYGSDAAVFRPERWFTDDSEHLAKMTRTNDMIFGYGRWVCLGRNIAMIEIHKCVFELFRHFDFALSNPGTPWKTFNSLGLWQIRDMWVDVSARE
jgi:cytochrome P450